MEDKSKQKGILQASSNTTCKDLFSGDVTNIGFGRT